MAAADSWAILTFRPMIPDQGLEDKELFARIAVGDEAAFGELFYQYLPRLERFVRDIVKSAPMAEEMIQEVFLRVWLIQCGTRAVCGSSICGSFAGRCGLSSTGCRNGVVLSTT